MFWDMFGKINYSLEGNDFQVSNLITSTVISYADDYLETLVIGQEKPEEVALRLYGSSEYFWVLLIVNNIVNPYYDWVMTSEELIKYCQLTYGVDNISKAHHYLDGTGREYDYDTSNIIAALIDDHQTVPYIYTVVSNFEHELNINAAKTTILTVPKNNLLAFIDTYQSSVRALTPTSN